MSIFMVGNAKLFNMLLNSICVLADLFIIILNLADVFCTRVDQFSLL